jgi:hypothetical protein
MKAREETARLSANSQHFHGILQRPMPLGIGLSYGIASGLSAGSSSAIGRGRLRLILADCRSG